MWDATFVFSEIHVPTNKRLLSPIFRDACKKSEAIIDSLIAHAHPRKTARIRSKFEILLLHKIGYWILLYKKEAFAMLEVSHASRHPSPLRHKDPTPMALPCPR
jgi:hypothetical protein